MAKNTGHVGKSQIRRQAALLAPKAWDAANAAASKTRGRTGFGFNQPWNDTTEGREHYVKCRKAGWIAGIEYALTEFQKRNLSPRATKPSVTKRKPK